MSKIKAVCSNEMFCAIRPTFPKEMARQEQDKKGSGYLVIWQMVLAYAPYIIP